MLVALLLFLFHGRDLSSIILSMKAFSPPRGRFSVASASNTNSSAVLFSFFFFLFFLRRRRLTLVTCNPSGAECYFALLTALMESMVDPITDVDGLDLTSRSRVADSLES